MFIFPVSVAVDDQVFIKCESFSHILASPQLDKTTSTKGNQNFILVTAVRCGLLIDKHS